MDVWLYLELQQFQCRLQGSFVVNRCPKSLIHIIFLRRKKLRPGDTDGGVCIRNREWWLLDWLSFYIPLSGSSICCFISQSRLPSEAKLHSLAQPIYDTVEAFCFSVCQASVRKMFAHNCNTIDAERPTILQEVCQLKDDFLIFSVGFPQGEGETLHQVHRKQTLQTSEDCSCSFCEV